MPISKTQTVTALVIPADIGQPVARRAIENELGALQSIVGGNIEAVPFHGGGPVAVFINDEGKFENPPRVNARATQLLGPGLRAGDFIAGDCVVTGLDVDTGENVDLVEGFEAQLEVRRTLPAPVEEHDVSNRHLEWRWQLAQLDPRREGGRRASYAVLSCSHRSAHSLGAQHGQLRAHLGRRSEETAGGIRSVEFALLDGLGILRQEIHRYSARQLEQFGARALSACLDMYGRSDHRVTKYFEIATGGAL